jgi:hypothetical protein
VTTEQVIVLAFLAGAFVAGWLARAAVGGRPRDDARASAAVQSLLDHYANPRATPPATVDREPVSLANRLGGAMQEGRRELSRAIRAYHAAVVRSRGDRRDTDSGQGTLEVLAGALVALSEAVEHAARELEPHHPLTQKLHGTGMELRRLAEDVTRHSEEPELPTGVFDRLEQNLISTATIVFAPRRPQANAS